MSHVSTEALELWWQWLEEEGLPGDLLVEGTRYTAAELRGLRRIPWDDFAVINERFCALVGGERMLAEVMRGFMGARSDDPLAPLYRSVAHPRHLYRAVDRFLGPLLFTIPESTLDIAPEGDTLRLVLRIPPPFRDCPAWFWACKGSLSQLPESIGWPRARVRLTIAPRQGTFDIELREPKRQIPRLRGLFTRTRQLDEATAELAARHAEVRRSYRILAEATRQQEVQGEREQRLARIGRQLTEQVALEPLLDAIAAICIDELGFTGIELAVPVDDDVITVERGQREGASREMPLERGRALGVLTVWAPPDHDDLGLFPGLLRWLALAVENALHFEAQRRTNAALEASEARWRALVQSLPDTVLTMDRDGRFTYINQSRYGLTADRVLGARAEAFGRDPEYTKQQLARVFEQGQTVSGERLWTGPDAVERFFTWRMGPIWGDGAVTAAVLVVRDETAQRRAEDERRELERRVLHGQKLESLGVLAGGIAHDFNNLLMGITANAELAGLQLPADHPARRFVQRIENAGTRAGDLTRQMLAYAGRRAVRPEPVDLTALVGELTDLLLSAVPKRVALIAELDTELPPVEADPAQLQQVVMNVLTNAADAIGPEGGSVTVRTARWTPTAEDLRDNVLSEVPAPGEHVLLEVSDTGCGMDATTRRKIFDPFFSTKATGRGLGLAAVLGIVRAHRGALLVRSTPGEGTVFRVSLPAAIHLATRRAAVAAAPHGSLAGRTVLVVDDEPVVRQVVSDLLSAHGAYVLTAADGPQGLALFARHDIDLVLLDLTMPGPQGDQVFDALRAARPDTRVVLTSGYDARDAVTALQRRGLVGFLRKPFDGRRLVEVVAEALP